MNSTLSPCDSSPLASILKAHGVYRFGIADVGQVDSHTRQIYEDWIARGAHASMEYLNRYPDVRFDSAEIFPGAKSVICCAFPYFNDKPQSRLRIARYALGDDYHEVIRRRLTAAGKEIYEIYDCEFRVCVDTAPVLERYWAVRSGLGFIGRNHQLILPGAGSRFFLAELFVSKHFDPSEPSTENCLGCNACIKACPAHALHCDGSFDACRCLSYLTIEHRGEFPEGTDIHGCFYGCDTCADVCPHNVMAPAIEPLPEFIPRPEITALTADDILQMTDVTFAVTFTRSAMKRAKLEGLRRNAKRL